MNRSTPLKLGFLGLAGHIESTMAGVRELGDVEVVAAAEEDPKRLEAFLKRFPEDKKPQGYEQWLPLLEHSMLDVCCVTGENGIRIDQLLALLERGVHIIAEKPLVTTHADLQRLRAAFAKSKSQLTMLLEMRHQPKNACVRDLIQKGTIGEVCQVMTQKSYKWGERAAWYKSRLRLGGTIPFIGVHSLDLIRWTTGLDFTHIAAFHGRSGQIDTGETEDQASILARLSNGASVTARLDYLRPASAPTHADDRIRIVGSNGILEVTQHDEAVAVITTTKSEQFPFGETGNIFAEFVRFLRGGPAPRITADDCFYITDVVLHARDAADEKKMIALSKPGPVRP